MILRLIVAVVLVFPQLVFAFNVIDVGAEENGTQTTGQLELLHDASNALTIADVEQQHTAGAFKPLQSAGSTGLKIGAFWSHFSLRNVSDEPRTFYIEYVDHQLVELDAYARYDANQPYQSIAALSLSDPFDTRPVSHNRFVFKVDIPAGQVKELMVKFASHQAGFVFPSMRIWSPDQLRVTHTTETSIIMFLFGGIFLMAIITLVGALATKDKTFLAYAVYAMAKIISWCTILGYTHQFIIKNHFHWNLLSVSASLGVLFGALFARTFLQTRRFTPKIDYVFLFMIFNAVFMMVCGAFGFTGPAVVSATIALFLYPMMSITGIVRWRQGSTDALVFALAWSLLVAGLVIQALRDLGWVAHNLMNYYWPAVASFVEMVGIMAAMGIKVRRLRLLKEQAEQRYLQQLENSKAELEQQVHERTLELEKAKLAAEHEARTDPLTGIYNRRSFFVEAGKRLNLSLRKQQPLSLLMFDIDHFKAINDTYGHAMGDEALRQFSGTIKANLRESDVWGRLGGEEFALVLSEHRNGTLQTAERLRTKIEGIAIDTPEGKLKVAASVGVAYLTDETSIEVLLNKADEALYQAKHQGRDQVVEYQAG